MTALTTRSAFNHYEECLSKDMVSHDKDKIVRRLSYLFNGIPSLPSPWT